MSLYDQCGYILLQLILSIALMWGLATDKPTESRQWGSATVSKAHEDVFTPTEVRTTLKITAPETMDNSTPSFTKTDACGYGWAFLVQWERISTTSTTISSKTSKRISSTTIEDFLVVSLDPYRLKNSALNSLNVIVKPNQGVACQKTVALGSSSSQLARIKVLNSSKATTVSISVSVLPEISKSSFGGHTLSVMTQSIASGRPLIDIKFCLFTQVSRGSGPKLLYPRLLYGNMEVLRGQCDYIDTLIDNDEFVESHGMIESGNLPQSASMEGYNYDSDSDLEDCDDSTLPADANGETVQSSSDVKIASASESTSGDSSIDTTLPTEMPNQHPGKTLLLKHHAYQTWKALLLFFYNGSIEFAPLTSNGAVGAVGAVGGDRCSPKSMYRLADELGLEVLKQKAATAIKEQINAENVVGETFSRFTSMYPEIQAIEVEILCKLYKQAKGVHEMMRRVAAGEMPYCHRILTRILDQMASVLG